MEMQTLGISNQHTTMHIKPASNSHASPYFASSSPAQAPKQKTIETIRNSIFFACTVLFFLAFMPLSWAGGEQFLEEGQGKRVDKAIIPSNYENKMSDPLDAKDTDMRYWVVDIDMVYKHEAEEGVCQEVLHRLVSSNLIPYQVGPGQEYIDDLLHKQQVLNDFEKSPYDRNGVEDVGFIDIDNDGTKENILRRSWSFRGVMNEKLYLLDSNLVIKDKSIVTVTKDILINQWGQTLLILTD